MQIHKSCTLRFSVGVWFMNIQDDAIVPITVRQTHLERYVWWTYSNITAYFQQGFGREKDGNRGKFISSNLIIFCYKEFAKFVLCKSVSQSKATEPLYWAAFELIKSGHVKINFSIWQHIPNTKKTE